VISLLDAVTEDLSMVNSLLTTPIVSRRDFGPVFKRVEGKTVANIHTGPAVRFYIPPLKGSATILPGAAAGQEKIFLPALNLSRTKADITSAPNFSGRTSVKLEDVMTALQKDCEIAHTNTTEVVRQDPPEMLIEGSAYSYPIERGVKFI